MKLRSLSFARLGGVMIKEFIQMKRDRMTFGMIIGIPVVQLIMFGYAINADPKYLPIAVVSADNSVYARSLIRAMENTKYFTVVKVAESEADATQLLETGDVQFVVTIPVDFARKLVRGERPALLIEADATDPSATGNAIAALQALPRLALQRDLVGPLQHLAALPREPGQCGRLEQSGCWCQL